MHAENKEPFATEPKACRGEHSRITSPGSLIISRRLADTDRAQIRDTYSLNEKFTILERKLESFAVPTIAGDKFACAMRPTRSVGYNETGLFWVCAGL